MKRYNVTVKFCAEDESVPALGADSKGPWGPWAEGTRDVEVSLTKSSILWLKALASVGIAGKYMLAVMGLQNSGEYS